MEIINCMLKDFTLCVFCNTHRLDKDSSFFPVIFKYLEDKGLQKELLGMEILVHCTCAVYM